MNGPVPRAELGIAGCGGLALVAHAWLPPAPRRLVVIAHGLAEHGGRYDAVAQALVRRGYGVYALDHRGHGLSPGRRAYVERFAWLVHDLGELVALARERHPQAPLFLFGHSMGGAVALAHALQQPQRLSGLVLSAPALGAPPAPWLQLVAARLLSRLAPTAGVLTLPASALSRDPTVVRAYEEDPLVFRGAIPARTAVELLAAMAGFPAAAPRLTLPTLVLHGTADTLVPLAAVRPVIERLGSTDLTLRELDGLYHEVLNEPEGLTVLAALLDWLDAH